MGLIARATCWSSGNLYLITIIIDRDVGNIGQLNQTIELGVDQYFIDGPDTGSQHS